MNSGNLNLTFLKTFFKRISSAGVMIDFQFFMIL